MKTIKSLFLASLICISVMLAACNGPNNSLNLFKPAMLDMNPPEGPQNYQQGWIDGCKSALAITNTDLHLTLGTYQLVLDKTMRYDSLYNKAWQYAYNHCGYSMRSLARYSF